MTLTFGHFIFIEALIDSNHTFKRKCGKLVPLSWFKLSLRGVEVMSTTAAATTPLGGSVMYELCAATANQKPTLLNFQGLKTIQTTNV